MFSASSWELRLGRENSLEIVCIKTRELVGCWVRQVVVSATNIHVNSLVSYFYVVTPGFPPMAKYGALVLGIFLVNL